MGTNEKEAGSHDPNVFTVGSKCLNIDFCDPFGLITVNISCLCVSGRCGAEDPAASPKEESESRGGVQPAEDSGVTTKGNCLSGYRI